MKEFHPLFKYIQWPLHCLVSVLKKVNNVMAILSRAMVGMGHVMTVRLVSNMQVTEYKILYT